MQLCARGVIAALLFSTAASGVVGPATRVPAMAAAGPNISSAVGPATRVPAMAALAPGGSTLRDGLTVEIRPFRASPVAAIEAWFGVPSDGYGPSKPGIARLSALAVAFESAGGKSLRDLARDEGGQLVVTVYPAATEIAVVVPSYAADEVVRDMMSRVFHPAISTATFLEARRRLAAQQAAYQGSADVTLRDAVFGSLFSAGTYHLSPYGTPDALASLTSEDVRVFLRRAFVSSNGIIVVAGDVNEGRIASAIEARAPLPGGATAVPPSPVDPKPQPIIVANNQTGSAGIALAWAGPPIADERSATALDFLADYLLRPDYGVVAQQIKAKYPALTVSGEFVTLRDPGVLYLTVTGLDVDATALLGFVREGVRRAIAAPMGDAEFARAIDIYRAHALRDNVASAEIIADNYGWYFVHGAPAYTPSATDANAGGDYYAQINALTPQSVYLAARRYLDSEPGIAELRTRPPSAAEAPRSTPTRGG